MKNVELNVSVVDLSANQKKIQVEIPAEKVRKEVEARYRDLAKTVRIKGFRPGKVPKSIIKSYFGKEIEHEVSSKFIQETFPEALRETSLKPLAEADVSETHFEDNGPFSYTAVVEVCPPFQVDGYRGMELKKTPVQVTDEQVAAELEKFREQHAQLRSLDEERPAREGDVVVVDFTPYIDGEPFEKGAAQDYLAEIGKNSIHPQFDENLVGRAPGETVTFEIDYPEDAPTPEIRGKRVQFQVNIKEIKEKELPELNDELASTIGKHDTLHDLRQAIHDRLLKQQEDQAKAAVRQQITEELLKKVELDLPEKALDREVDRLIGNLQHQFQSQGLQVDASRFDTPAIRTEYRPQAALNLKQKLIFQQIAKQEGIELAQEEVEEIFRQIAMYARMDLEKVKQDFADSVLVEQSKEAKIQDKVFQLIEEAADHSAASQETAPEQEDQ